MYGSLSASRFTSGQVDAFLTPRVHRAGRPLVVYCHGSGGNAAELLVSLPAVRALTRYLVAEVDDGGLGAVVVAPTQTNTWGNATSNTRIDNAVTWARANLGVNSDPPLLIGASHGACCAVAYAFDNAVAGLVLLIPALDLQYLRVQDVVEGIACRAVIDAAWSVTYPAALPAGANTIDVDPGVPDQVWAASDDDISSNVSTWAATYGAEFHNVGALGHTNAAIAAADPEDVVAFAGPLVGVL